MIIKSIKQFLRLITIYKILWRNGLHQWLIRIPGHRSLHVLSMLYFWGGNITFPQTSKKQTFSRGHRLRISFEQLGPLFVKFGQLLSTRRDWIPEDIIQELAQLQDKVPPFPGE